MTDYRMKVWLKGGQVRETTYQHLLTVLGFQKEEALGQPLLEGTVYQARYLAICLECLFTEIEKVRLYDEKGQEL